MQNSAYYTSGKTELVASSWPAVQTLMYLNLTIASTRHDNKTTNSGKQAVLDANG